MKYPPPHHQTDDKTYMLEVIKAYSLATLISVENNKPFITHLPLIYREHDGKLIGHIDIYNPHSNLLKNDNEVSIIFSGPDCYISPTVYGTDQLPTWNYIKVHLQGTVKAIESKEALRDSLIIMTEFLEPAENGFILKPDNPKMARALDYIRMFEIEITAWEGKFKLSQDKKKSDRIFAKEELLRENRRRLSELISKLI